MTENIFNWLAVPPEKRPDSPAEIYEALGQFVVLFASTEILLQLTLWHRARISTPVARAVFSGVKAEEAINRLKRIFQVSEVSAADRETYKDVFTHIGWIADVRNLILHHGLSSDDENKFLSTNSWWALTPERVQQMPVNVKLLRNLALDTIKANSHLQINTINDPEIRANIENLSREQWQRAWLYTPEPPRPQKKRLRSNAPKRQRQR